MWTALLTSWILGLCSVAVAVACPNHCQCFVEEGLRTADCSGSVLTSINQKQQQQSNIDVLNIRPHYSGFRTKLTSRGFKTFRNIKFFNLSNTSITALPDEVFFGLSYIITIDLSYNKIKHLNGGVFKDLNTLQTLLLRGNPLLLTQNDIIVSKSLRKLDLGNCGLRNIPIGTFAHVQSLTALFLDGNSIQILNYNSVPLGVWYLNLANNNIINVPIDLLRSMRSLTRIDMSGNPIKCTCHLLLLQDAFSGQGRTFENDIICSGPRQFSGQKLSQINENELCNLEFMKKERFMNSIKHFRDVRSYRKHNMIKSPYDDGVQGDQPYISDDLTPNHDIEVMYSNDDTRSMGTHMSANALSSIHLTSPLDLSDENNKLSVSKQTHHDLLTTDPSSTEFEAASNENDDQNHPEELKMPEEEDLEEDDVINTVGMNSNDDKQHSTHHHDSAEEFNEKESNLFSSTEKTEEKLDVSVKSAITSDTDKSSVMFNHTVPTEDFDTDEETLADQTESTVIHDLEELTSDHAHKESLSSLSDPYNANSTDTSSSSLPEDVEDLTSHHSHNYTNEEPLSRYSSHLHHDYNTTNEFDESSISSVDDIFGSDSISTLSPEIQPYTWPTSKADITDYNYDTQHDDYSSVDPTILNQQNTTKDTSNIPLTTEVYSDTEDFMADQNVTANTYSLETEEEGSGEILNETSISSEDGTTVSVQWMEEQENETTSADYSVENITEWFKVITDENEFSRLTVENASTETEDMTTVTPELISLSSETETTESATEESTTEEITTMETVVEETSSQDITSHEISSTSLDNETEIATTEFVEDLTSYTTTEESTDTPLIGFDEITTESSTVVISSTQGSSQGYSPSLDVTSVSSSLATSEDTSTAAEVTEVSSTEATTIPLLIPDIDLDEEEEEEAVSSSTSVPVTSPHPLDVSSPIIDIPIHSTSPAEHAASSTPVSEVEFVTTLITVDDKENIILDPTKEEVSEEKDKGPDVAMIGIIAVIMLLVLIIIAISLAVVCRKTKRPKNKIRLPADTEANLGTEMQDMLLPKPPENGVKVVPKNYTNGTTAANGNSAGNKAEQKEEETPVLSEEPEQMPDDTRIPTDWEDKPEPIETVTARLTMLARPQTPVFIPKTVN